MRCAGPAKTVEFEFDLGEDTAASVAGEMVEEMALSQDDAHAIATAIKDEVRLLTGMGSPLNGDAFPQHLSKAPSASANGVAKLPSAGGSPLSTVSEQDTTPAAPTALDGNSSVPRAAAAAEPANDAVSAATSVSATIEEDSPFPEGMEADVHVADWDQGSAAEPHVRQLSRRISPPKEEAKQLQHIHDLFAGLQVGIARSSCASWSVGYCYMPPGASPLSTGLQCAPSLHVHHHITA